MPIIKDKEDELSKELSTRPNIINDLFQHVTSNLELGIDYSTIFDERFIQDDGQGQINFKHIIDVMQLIRDYHSGGKMFYNYFEKRWLKPISTEELVDKWELTREDLPLLIDLFGHLIVSTNKALRNDNKIEIGENIAKTIILTDVAKNSVNDLTSDDPGLQNIVTKSLQKLKIDLDDCIEFKEIEVLFDEY